jgi:hypothetical protein
MDLNEYTMGHMVHARLDDLRAEAIRCHLVAASRQAGPLRIALGRALIRLGQMVVGDIDRTLVPRPS